jgi:hypothetical protein
VTARATGRWPSTTAPQHEEMGFLEGWGAVLDQMVAFIKAG